uniref:TraB/GumN family protein n=1 Tax=Archaeoglobus fulgidus TaxID=2234 RepID=A0A7J3M1U2_ARCFL
MEKKLIIIGTAHVSQKSVEEVVETIEKERPEAVAVELCPRRYNALLGKREEIDVKDVIKRGDFLLILLQLLLGYFQRKVGEELKVKPGEDMLSAIRKAREIGADVILIDRDIAITFKRLWGKMSFFEKLKFFYHVLRGFTDKTESVDDMLREDIIEMLVKEFRKISPKAAEVLIDERDAFMAFNLKKAFERYNSVVAVVGAGHKKGILDWIQKDIDVAELMRVREGKGIKIVSILFAVFIVVLFLAMAVLAVELFYQAFLYWFLITGIFAAIGAIAARAHPVSIAVAFLCAWFTTPNPLIAVGWFSGFTEAWIRKPTLSDVENLFKARSLGEMWKNSFFRVILVAALTNLGGTIGTIYGSYYLLTNFGVDVAKVVSKFFGL